MYANHETHLKICVPQTGVYVLLMFTYSRNFRYISDSLLKWKQLKVLKMALLVLSCLFFWSSVCLHVTTQNMLSVFSLNFMLVCITKIC